MEREVAGAQTFCLQCRKDYGTAEELSRHMTDEHVPAALKGRPKPDDIFSVYSSEATRHGLLSREEEIRLAREIKKGGRKADIAKKKLIESNLRLVLSIVRTYFRNGVQQIDLVQDGNMGLIHAAEKFNPSFGCRFSTYATWWIRQHIQNGLKRMGRAVWVPFNVLDTAARAKKLLLEHGEDGSLETVAKIMETTPEALQEAMRHSAVRGVSMESGDQENGKDTLGRVLSSDDPAPPPLDKSELVRVLSVLSTIERHVISRRFGLDGLAPAELRVLADDLHISRERVRQLEANAISVIRKRRLKNQGKPTDEDGALEFDLRPMQSRSVRRRPASGRRKKVLPGQKPKPMTLLERKWHRNYGKLRKFKERNGHCNVRRHGALGQWSLCQRLWMRKGKLSRQQIQALDKLGFAWGPEAGIPEKPVKRGRW